MPSKWREGSPKRPTASHLVATKSELTSLTTHLAGDTLGGLAELNRVDQRFKLQAHVGHGELINR